ncbi:MAG: anaerobic sulfite reductase subunit AsrA [Candidatus Rifleibacteriota bacterium]
MQAFEVKGKSLELLFSQLNEKFRIVGPVRFKKLGRFSDTDLVKYAELKTFDDLELSDKSNLSPKSLVFPPDETMFYFTVDQFTEPELDDDRETIVFLRPCDINGIERLDKIFLENGDQADPYYKRRRDKLHFFMIECTEGFENCFCVSMNANHSENYAVAVQFKENNIKAQIKDEKFIPFFAESGEKIDFKPAFIKENQKKVDLPKVENMPEWIFADDVWEEYDSRCIACGRCNTSCVTCSCFTTRDIFYPDSRQSGERRRVWDGCHLDGFTEMAGGHSYRNKKGDRMRFKTFHKIYDFHKRFGVDMCVGCGRCDDVCPEYISFSACINKVKQRLKEVKEIEE